MALETLLRTAWKIENTADINYHFGYPSRAQFIWHERHMNGALLLDI